MGTYLQRGYLPLPSSSCHGSFPAASISLEWSVDDFAISQFASALGDSDSAGEFQDRAQYWQTSSIPRRTPSRRAMLWASSPGACGVSAR